ncbi:MAG: sensor histidine kinase [Bacteroidetes bacterium]|nr:sensor histidine kinase [Bacteroidota bacterium]
MTSTTPFDVTLLLVFGTVSLVVLIVSLISFLILYQKKQFQYLQDKESLKNSYEQEILRSQLEIQNNTLEHIGQELHDNIGQLLILTGINLKNISARARNTDVEAPIQQTSEIVKQVIQEVRALTKSLNGEFVKHFGLLESLTHELERIKKANIQTHLDIKGEPRSMGYEQEIVLFRIVQECLSNSLKYAEASTISVRLNYEEGVLLEITDDGKGFDLASVMERKLSESGAGLRNMQRRASLLGASCEYLTQPGQGTRVVIRLSHVKNPKPLPIPTASSTIPA